MIGGVIFMGGEFTPAAARTSTKLSKKNCPPSTPRTTKKKKRKKFVFLGVLRGQKSWWMFRRQTAHPRVNLNQLKFTPARRGALSKKILTTCFPDVSDTLCLLIVFHLAFLPPEIASCPLTSRPSTST